MSGMEDSDDPGADTAMFRAYVEHDPAGQAPTSNRTALVGAGVAVAVAVLVVLAILVLA